MRDVLVALLPALAVSTWVYGTDVLTVSAIAVVSCVVIEFLIQKFLLGGEPTVSNLSAAVTGLLLAFNLPASIPWWIVVIGSAVAIGVAKMTFGGLGRNPFNPALVGRVFLLIAYPVQMTSFSAPTVEGYSDAFSGATPLAAVKSGAVSVEDADLLLLLTLGEDTRADGEDGEAEPHIEHFGHDVEHGAFPFIYPGNADQDIHQRHCGNGQDNDIACGAPVVNQPIFGVNSAASNTMDSRWKPKRWPSPDSISLDRSGAMPASPGR